MSTTSTVRRILAIALFGSCALSCYARARVHEGPHEECHTVAVRNRHDVEVCRTRCTDRGCHERCAEHERYARERRCWVD